MLKRALLAAVFALLTIAGSVRPAYADQFGATTRPPTPKPCDLLSGGCIDAWSVVETLAASYDGPLFQASRSDGSFQLIPAIPQTGIVNVGLLHQFCDGYDCWVATLYDQVGPNNFVGNTITGPANHIPLIGWKANGLPEIVMSMNQDDWTTPANATTPAESGAFLTNLNPTGLPTTGSRATYIVSDNAAASGCCGIFSYGPLVPHTGAGGDWDINVIQQSINQPTSVLFGGNFNNFYYTMGAYPPGFAQLAGYMKFNAATNVVQAGVLTSACIPSTANACNSYTTYQGTPGAQAVNTGDGQPLTLSLGQEGDSFPYGGRVQSVTLSAFSPSSAEDSAVLNALASVHFPKNPSACGAVKSTLTATAYPGSLNATPSYVGLPALNQPSLLAMWSTSLLNPDYLGPLFRAVRQDTGRGFDIYPAGCEVDVTTLTADCLGTTCNVPVVFDQSGHGWQMRSTIPGNPPTLNVTGMNGLPCLNFVQQNFAQFAASVNSSGVLNVTSMISGGPIQAPTDTQIVGEFYPQVISAQLTGTTGGVGTYQTSSPAAHISGTLVSNASQMLRTDKSVSRSPNAFNNVGLYQNTTVELVAQPPSNYVGTGSYFNLEGGWSIAMTGGNEFALYDSQNTKYLSSPAVTLNQAHFVSFQTNAAATQTLTLTVDNTTPATTTTSSTQIGSTNSGWAYALGQATAVNGQNGCVAQAAVYNDVESPANLLSHYRTAHTKWATP